jgi:hypothetical protein
MSGQKIKIRNSLLKLWPSKKWKKALVVIFLVLIAVGSFFEWSVYREVATPMEVKNSEGSKSGLLIYHPGLTSFAHDIAYSFADGLVSNDWKVDIATASPQAPVQITKYDLIVLCWPIYDFNPGPTITNHLKRIGNLQGIDTVVVTLGGGVDPLKCAGTMADIVQNANGTVRESLTAFRGGTVINDMWEAGSKILP